MKLTKLASMTVVATLALGVYSAKAAVVGTTTNYSKLTISAVITTNGTSTTVNHVSKYPTGTVKLSNKELIALFAQWSTNNLATWQAAGAQLEFDWTSYQAVVADKTGTNILFYSDDNGLSPSPGFLNIEWFDVNGTYNEVWVNKSPGSDTTSRVNLAYFQIYYSKVGDSAHYLNFGDNGTGPSLEKYTQLSSSPGVYTAWTDSEQASTFDVGTYNNENRSTISVKLSATGHGKGANSYIY